MTINIFRLLQRTKIAGPGYRFCIWVQGCSRHCDGCMAEETWSHDDSILMSTEELFEQIIWASKTSYIEGITFLGGEPFEQSEAVATLAEQVRGTGLSVVTFTGFTVVELLAQKDESIQRLLSSTDLLIDGPFIKEQFDLSKPWIGSSNQQYHFLTDRYSENDLLKIKNQIEIRIATDGKALVNGMGDFSMIKQLL